MTDEELRETLKEIIEDVKKLARPESKLTKEEYRRKQMLLLKGETLKKIKEAREQNQKNEEIYHSMVYGLLTSWGEKHPYWASLVQANFRWDGF